MCWVQQTAEEQDQRRLFSAAEIFAYLKDNLNSLTTAREKQPPFLNSINTPLKKKKKKV